MSSNRDVQGSIGRETRDRGSYGAPTTHGVGERATERRDVASRIGVLGRVSSEFQEMPGLRLTEAQAQRLFSLRPDICTRVLATLVDRSVLRRDPSGAYVLDGHRS